MKRYLLLVAFAALSLGVEAQGGPGGEPGGGEGGEPGGGSSYSIGSTSLTGLGSGIHIVKGKKFAVK